MNSETPYHQKFESLVAELENEITALKKENSSLKNEINTLKSKTDNGDLFANVNENDRSAMRQQVKSLIEKIDQYLPK